MSNSADPSASPRPRRTADDRELRRRRIFARLQEGWSYEAIAEAEDLSRERIRQIIVQTLDQREIDPNRDHTRLQIARLDPALRLAGEAVAKGEIKAIDRLLRVLERLDKYQGAAVVVAENEGDARERILAKLSLVDERRAAYAKDNWSPP